MSTSQIILCSSYGNHETYKLTKENAQIAFESHIENLSKEYILIAEDKDSTYLSMSLITKILKEVLETPEQSNLPTLQKMMHGKNIKNEKDNRPQFLNTKENIQDLAIFLMKNNLTQQHLKNSNLDIELIKEIEELSFIKLWLKTSSNTYKYVRYDEELEIVRKYQVIIGNKWKEGAKEEAIAHYILNFINENLVDTSDIKYEVVSYNDVMN